MTIRVRAAAAKVAEILVMDRIGENMWDGSGVSATKVKEQLDALGEVDTINVLINSPGGNVWDGLAIFNLLKQHEATINVSVEALAASAASIIAMAGDTIVMREGAMMMIHNPASLAWGGAADMRKVAEMLDAIAGEMAGIYATRSGMKRADVIAAMDVETWYNGEQAVAAGLADSSGAEAAEPSEEAAAAMQSDAWAKLLAQYKHVPESVAARITPARAAVAAIAQTLPTDSARSTVATTSANTPQHQEPQAMNEEEIRAKATADALAAEQKRREGVRAVFAAFLIATLSTSTLAARTKLRDECQEDQKCTPDMARAKLLDLISVENIANGSEPVGGFVQAGATAHEKFLVGARQALDVRAGIAKRESNNEFYGRTLCDLAEVALRHANVPTAGLTKDGIARKVLAHSSSDFPSLLSNTAGKSLRKAYSELPATWRAAFGVGQVSDFKTVTRIQLGSFGNLQLIPEGSEYRYTTTKE
jgi:ATP-dependent protease ClpP protease subunit